MRHLLALAMLCALLAGSFAGVASAGLSEDDSSSGQLDPFDAPADMPSLDPSQPFGYGYRSADDIASELEASVTDATADPGAPGGVAVTATVLPVVIVAVDDDGAPLGISTNTSERDAQSVLYLFRRGSDSGEPVALDASMWDAARTALASTGAGTGSVWQA